MELECLHPQVGTSLTSLLPAPLCQVDILPSQLRSPVILILSDLLSLVLMSGSHLVHRGCCWSNSHLETGPCCLSSTHEVINFNMRPQGVRNIR